MPLFGNVVISKKFLRTRKIMVMHSNERGECRLRTLIVRSDAQGSDAIQELIKGGELHWVHLFGEFQIDMEVVSDDLRSHRRRDSRSGGRDEAAQPESLA